MAGGYPAFGGTNDVTLMDIGQLGGTLNPDGEGTVQVFIVAKPLPDRAPTVNQRFPQGGWVVSDRMGFSGGGEIWTFSLFADTLALMRSTIATIESYRHGSLRSSAGVLGAADPTLLVATQLTDYLGNVLCPSAILDELTLPERHTDFTDGVGYVGATITWRFNA